MDSSVIIAHFRGKLDLFEHVSAAEPLFVPLVALGELLKGALKSGNPTRHRAKIDAFLKIVAVLNPDFETAERYAQTSVALASKGYSIPENDLWIAATALELEMPLATRDAHFQRVEGLEVLAW